MAKEIAVNIVPCEHPEFENYICLYCGSPCKHERPFNSDGVCTACGFECPHTEMGDDHNCTVCGNGIIASVSSSSNYYINFTDAVSALQNDDVMTLYHDVSFMDPPPDVTASCTINLNGYSLRNFYINLNNDCTVIDTAGGGFMCVSGAGNISIKASETTNIKIMISSDNLKVFSGRIVGMVVYNVSKNSILFDDNIFVLHTATESRKLTRTESASLSQLNDGEYLTVEQCPHDKMNSERHCFYCGKSLTTEECITILLNEIENNKKELQDLIDKKASVDLLNEKVSALNEAISNAESSIKSYADGKDTALKEQLENKITTEKQNAMTYADTILATAKSELQDLIDKKASVELLNEKVSALNEAISNAETSIKSYADGNDTALKEQLEGEISLAKETLQSAISEISERLTVAEKKIDENTDKINSLSTALIVISIILSIAVIGGFAVVFVLIRKLKIK